MSRVLTGIILILCWFSGMTARAAVAPIPEAAQGALAQKILTDYYQSHPVVPAKVLHVVYYTPADRAPESNYVPRLSAIMDDINAFYRDGMKRCGFGPETFAMERDAAGKLVIHLVKGRRAESEFTVWEGRNNNGTGSLESGPKVAEEIRPSLSAAGISLDRETVLIFCNLANWDPVARTFRHHSPYFGQSGDGWGRCFAADSAILKLDDIRRNEPILDDQEFGKMSLGKFETIFIGGVAHELGHAFLLPHCGERTDEKALGTSIMGAGNHTYREELRGEGHGSFLTMASAMRLASNPIFSGSNAGWGDAASVQADVDMTTNVTRADLAGRRGTLRVEGTLHGSIPVYGVIAYFDSLHDGGYYSPTATSVPDAQGRFAIEISDLKPCKKGDLRIEFCHANGAISTCNLEFAVTGDGSVDLSQWRQREALQPVGDAVEQHDLAKAQVALAKLEKDPALEPELAIARSLVATLEAGPTNSPAAVPPDVNQLFLGNARAEEANVGWLSPAYNHVPADSLITSPFLDSDKLYATGLYAHAPSRYVFDLGAKWKTLQGEAGLHTFVQSYAPGVVFVIKADGREVYRSGTVKGARHVNYSVDVSGVKQLELTVEKANKGNGGNWGLWLEPELTR